MAKRDTHIMANEDVWHSFRDFVYIKHGKISGALGDEVSNALKTYLELERKEGMNNAK